MRHDNVTISNVYVYWKVIYDARRAKYLVWHGQKWEGFPAATVSRRIALAWCWPFFKFGDRAKAKVTKSLLKN